SMFHSAVKLKGLHHTRNARPFLAYGNIDANDIAALLVDDRIKGNRRLSCLAVTDDELPLSPTNRDHRINCLYSCLERLPDRLPVNNTRCNDINYSACLGIDRPLAVNRLPDGIYNASDHFLSDWDRHDLSRPFDNVAFLNVGVLAEQDRSNHVFFKVKRHAKDIIGELEKLRRHAVVESVNPGDTIADRNYNTHLADINALLEIGYLLFQILANLIYLDFHAITPL